MACCFFFPERNRCSGLWTEKRNIAKAARELSSNIFFVQEVRSYAGVPGVSGTATLGATKDNSTGLTTPYATTSVGTGFALSYIPFFTTVEGNVSGGVRISFTSNDG
jgi:hypothetical protein